MFLRTGNDAKSKEGNAQRRALLLYSAGARVRSVFKTLDYTGEAHEYDTCLAVLNAHYVVKPNVTFQRHLFRKIIQEPGETVTQYVTKLRNAGIAVKTAT